MKQPSHCQECEQRHSHTTALLCTWAARRPTHRDNGGTWLDTSKHIAAVNSAVILSRRGAVLSQGEFFGEVKGDCGGSVSLIWEADKTFSVCLWPSFPGHSARLKGPEWRGQARPGQDFAPFHCQGQLHCGDVAQNRSARGHAVDCRGSEKTMLGGKRGWVRWGDSHQPYAICIPHSVKILPDLLLQKQPQ